MLFSYTAATVVANYTCYDTISSSLSVHACGNPFIQFVMSSPMKVSSTLNDVTSGYSNPEYKTFEA